MQSAEVTVTVNGQPFSLWEEISVMASVQHAARSFSLRIADPSGGPQAAQLFALFAPVQIFEGGEIVFNGFVDRRSPKLTAKESGITISGRAKGQDSIDCSATHPTGRFTNQTPLQIAQALDKFGIGFSSDVELDKVTSYQLKPGASHFREIEKLVRDQGATLSGQPNGSIKITKAGQTAKSQTGILLEGFNFEEIEGEFSADHRHSEVRVRGQSYDGHGTDALEIEGVANDSEVPRYRPLVFVQDANTDKTRAKNRAKNKRDKAAGNGIKVAGLTPGWRDEGGTLWTPGNTIWTSSPFLALEQIMLIETLTYKVHCGHGSATHLSLVDPRAHGGKSAGQAAKSGSQWNFDSSEGSDD